MISITVMGCNSPPTCFDEESLTWPEWVAATYVPLDDAGVVIEESDQEIITRHDSASMACAGHYSCLVGWRVAGGRKMPVWIECEVEIEPSVWGCIHWRQPRPQFRFSLRPASGKWIADQPISLTPWLDAVLEAIRNERVWHIFQICRGELLSDRYEAEVLGCLDGDENWSNLKIVAVKEADNRWRAGPVH